jgi:hypothetical protein
MFETNNNPFLQLFNPLLNNQGFLGSTTQARQNQFSPVSPININAMMPNVQAAMSGITGVGAASGAPPVPPALKEAPSLLTSGLGMGLTLTSTAMSYIQADKQKAAMLGAKREAERLAEDARRRKEQNLYEATQVPLQAYDRQFREGIAANAQAVEALSQDPRMLLGGIQGVQEATIEGQAKTREALADRIYTDAMTKAGAGMAINQDLAKLDLEEAQGAQTAAMAAEKAMVAQQQAALQGVGGLITQGAGMVGTYGGFANEGDKLQTLLGGTSFARPSAQPTQAQLLQMISQNPNLLMQLLGQPKSTLG